MPKKGTAGPKKTAAQPDVASVPSTATPVPGSVASLLVEDATNQPATSDPTAPAADSTPEEPVVDAVPVVQAPDFALPSHVTAVLARSLSTDKLPTASVAVSVPTTTAATQSAPSTSTRPSTESSSAQAPPPSPISRARRDSSLAPTPPVRTGMPPLIAAAAASPGPLAGSSTRTARGPSMTPGPPSLRGTPAPRSSVPPAPVFRRAPTPSTQSSAGLPPTVRSMAAPSSIPASPAPVFGGLPPMVHAAPAGLPPTVGISQARQPPSPQDAATLAAAAVASIIDVRPTPPPPPPKRKRNRKRANAEAQDEAEEVDGDADGAGTSQPSSRPSKRPSVRRRDHRNDAEEPEELSDPDAPPAGPRVIKRKGMYGSAGVAGTSQDRRLKANRKAKAVQVESVSESVLDTAQPEELIGGEIDPSTITIGDLATHTGIGTGHVSARGIRLHKHRSEEIANKRKAAEARQIIRWQEKQIQRRKLRAMKNAERARRRRQMEEMGEDSAVVSPDEEDSEEEFAVLPERLTPPTTPEPDDEPRRPEDDGQTDGLEREYGEQMDVDHQNVGENRDNEPGENGQGGDVDLDALLRRGGFDLDAEDRLHADGDEDGENGDGDEEFRYDEDEDATNLADFRARQEEERRRILEGAQDREVEEDDNETRMINNASFSKKNTPNERWTTAETEFFFLVGCSLSRRLGVAC